MNLPPALLPRLACIACGAGSALAGWGVPADSKLIFAAAVMLAGSLSLLPAASGLGFQQRATAAFAVLAAFATWQFVAAQCIVAVSNRGEVFLPLWLSGDVATMVERAGGRVAAIERYGRDAVALAVADMPAAAAAHASSLAALLASFVATFALPVLGWPKGSTASARALSRLNIFISYRRNDAAAYARLVFEHFRPRCRTVVLDVDVLPLGQDFAEAIDHAIEDCDVVLAVIGPDWTGGTGRGRRAEDDDMVAHEIVTALARGKLVLPLLVRNARMPPADRLPIELAPLARINALELRHESFARDMSQLETFLASALPRRQRTAASV